MVNIAYLTISHNKKYNINVAHNSKKASDSKKYKTFYRSKILRQSTKSVRNMILYKTFNFDELIHTIV